MEQLGGGSRAVGVNLWDVPLLFAVLEALGKSCFFSSLCFLFCKTGGPPADIQHLAWSESSDFQAGLQIIPEHALICFMSLLTLLSQTLAWFKIGAHPAVCGLEHNHFTEFF